MRNFLLILLLIAGSARAQTLGGGAAYNFLKLPASPLLTAAGGINASYQGQEAGLSAHNPALLNEAQHGQLNLSFNSFLAGIKTYSTSGVYHASKWGTTLGGNIHFVNYGSVPQTDAAGNINGEFRPVDFSMQVSAARSYLQRWHYGLTLKIISSRYGKFSSSALAFDGGVLYQDSANGFSASLLAKNMGYQLSSYAGEKEDLPFDLQVGFTKRLSKSPFGFSVTAQQLHRFNLVYNDTTFNQDNELTVGNSFASRLFNHFVFASHIYIGNHIEATVGYNHLRRNELSMGSTGNGMTGFSLGARIKFQKLQVLYARSTYQSGVAFNQLAVNLQLNRMFGLGE